MLSNIIYYVDLVIRKSKKWIQLPHKQTIKFPNTFQAPRQARTPKSKLPSELILLYEVGDYCVLACPLSETA